MSKNLLLQLQLKATDQASRVVESASNKIRQANQNVASSSRQSANAQQQSVRQTAQVSEQAARTAIQASRRVAQAREGLGIRSERQIQREIQRTVAQYERLKRSGTASARELARANEVARNKIRELNAEMGKTPMGQRLGNIGRGVMGIGAGIMAGSMVMAEPVRKSMGYDRDLAMVANTAFSDRDVEGRIAGKKELADAVENAVKTGGGTKEEALGALDQLLASGTVKAESAMNLLPTLQKSAVATGADARELSSIAISAMQNGIAEADIGKVLDMAVAAGQAGNFELKDMARWLPQQMAAAKQMGLTGLAGFERLLVANQQARVTAGTSDEAGNNLVNLLAKITSKETNKRFEDYEYIDSKGKKRSINYLKSMEAYKKQGKDSLEAFMAIMDDVVGSDQNYRALQTKLKKAKGKQEQEALLNQMTNLVEGTAIGQIISDRQALMALLGIRNNLQLGKEVQEQVQNSEGSVEKSHAVVASTNDYKTESAKTTAEFAQMKSLEGFNNLLGSASETLVEYANKYPDLTVALTGAATGIGALGAAALAAAGSVALLGGRGGLSLPDLFRRGAGGLGRGATAGATRAAGSTAASSLSRVATSGGSISGNMLKAGSRALGAVGFLAIAAEQQPYVQAQSEVNDEKQAKAKEQFAKAMQPQKTSMFQYNVPVPASITNNKQSVPLYGGYALAALNKDDEVAKARLEMGSYNNVQYQQRLERNQQRREQLGVPRQVRITPTLPPYMVEQAKSPMAIYPSATTSSAVMRNPNNSLDKANTQFASQAVTSMTNFASSLTKLNGEFVGLNAQQMSTKTQVDSFGTVLANYQADFQAFGQRISDGLQAGLTSQSHTLENRITVELDGRVIAEQTSQQFFNFANRGTA